MTEIEVSATSLLVAIACVIALVAIACFYFASKRKYKQKVDAVAANTKQRTAALDELFKPVKRTTREDVDHFLVDNHDAINAAKEINEPLKSKSRTASAPIIAVVRLSICFY